MNKESELKASLYAMIYLEPHGNEHDLVNRVVNRVLDEAVERVNTNITIMDLRQHEKYKTGAIHTKVNIINEINKIREEL